MGVSYPNLAAEIARRGIKKTTIASSIGICDRSLSNKLKGKVPFTWPEVYSICNQFFPDKDPAVLFAKASDQDSA